MEALLWILLVVLVVLAVMAVAGYLISRRMIDSSTARAAKLLPPAEPTHWQAPAGLAKAAAKGPGVSFGLLRLTEVELLFADARAGTVLHLARNRISRVVSTNHLGIGMGAEELTSPVLMVSVLQDDGHEIDYGFAVTDIAGWVAQLAPMSGG